MRTFAAVLAATAAVALTACGSGDDDGATAGSPDAAKASVEDSARIQPAPQAVPLEDAGVPEPSPVIVNEK